MPKTTANFVGNVTSVIKTVGSFAAYSALILAKSIRAMLRWSAIATFSGVNGFRIWLKTPHGVAWLCALCIGMVLAALWLIDSVRFLEKKTASAQEESISAIELPVDATEQAPNPLILTVNGQALHLNDVVEFAHQAGRLPMDETLTLEEVAERGLIEEALDQTLLSQAALNDTQVWSDPLVQTQLRMARGRILSAALLRNHIAETATETLALEIYQSQQSNLKFGDAVRLRRIVVSEASLAADLQELLLIGHNFAQLARDYSIENDTSDLGYRTYAQLPKAYAERVFAMRRGEHSPPFETDHGWVILKVEGRRSVKPPSFDEVKDEMLEFLKLQAISGKLAELREVAEIDWSAENAAAPVTAETTSTSTTTD